MGVVVGVQGDPLEELRGGRLGLAPGHPCLLVSRPLRELAELLGGLPDEHLRFLTAFREASPEQHHGRAAVARQAFPWVSAPAGLPLPDTQ